MDEFNQVSLYGNSELVRQVKVEKLFRGAIKILVVLLFGWTPLESAAQNTWPEVHDEPFHKPIFETNQYRMLRLAMNPGDTSAFHTHSSPIFYFNIRQCKVFIDTERSRRLIELPAGWTGSNFWSTSVQHLHRIAPSDGDTLLLYAFQSKLHVPLNAAIPDSASTVGDFEVIDYAFGSSIELPAYPIIMHSGHCNMSKLSVRIAGEYILPGEIQNISMCSKDAAAYSIRLPKFEF